MMHESESSEQYRELLKKRKTSIKTTAFKTTENFEDNLKTPHHGWQFLVGRCLDEHGMEDFTADWVYARFVNRVMQSLTDTTHPWYRTEVEGPELSRKGHAGKVVVCFTVLAPLLFPIVYGLMFFVLTVCCCFSFVLLQRWQKLKPHLRALSMLQTAVWSLFHCWRGVFPFYFLLSGRKYICDMDTCYDHGTVKIYFSDFSVLAVAASSLAAGFRITRSILVSACDCACHSRQIVREQDPAFGPALKKTNEVLADPADPWSYFPIVIQCGYNDSDTLRVPLGRNVLLFLAALVACAAPHAWMTSHYNQPPFPSSDDYEAWIVLLTLVCVPTHELWLYFRDFYLAIKEYQGVVEQVLVFIYLGANHLEKNRPLLSQAFKTAISENDKARMSLTHLEGVKHFEDANERFKLSRLIQEREFEKNKHLADELALLKVYRVAVNLSTPDGVIFYRRLREWLTTDMLNERAEIEMFINMSTIVTLVGFMSLVWTWMSHQHQFTSMSVCLPLPIFVLWVYILRSLNLCAFANEYLYDYYERILLGWKGNIQDPLSNFGDRLPAIGWYWNEETEQEAPLPFGDENGERPIDEEQPSDKEAKVETQKMLSLSIKLSKVSEEKQRILGVEATHALRTRILATGGTAILTLGMRFGPWLLKMLDKKKT